MLPAVGSRGTVGRNTITGPGLVTFDPSLTKSFFLNQAQTKSAQFRIEIFNAFNQANFAIPSVANLTIFNSPTDRNGTAGQITQTSTPGRQVQLALRITARHHNATRTKGLTPRRVYAGRAVLRMRLARAARRASSTHYGAQITVVHWVRSPITWVERMQPQS